MADNSSNSTTPPPRPWCPEPTRSDLQYLLHFYIIPITAVIGTFLNLLCLYIFCKFRQKSSATFLLKFVCVLDTVNLVKDAVFPHVGMYPWCLGDMWLLACMYTVTGGLSMLPFWVILLISIDRYAHVCQPLLARRLNTLRLTRLSILIVTLLVVLAMFVVNIVRFVVNKGHRPVALSTTTAILVGIVPFPITAIFNLMVIYRLRNRDFHVQDSVKGTVMILTMTVSFLLLKVPNVAMIIGNMFDSSIFSNTYVSIALYMDTVNFSANFWLYFLSARSFRDALKKVLVCKGRKWWTLDQRLDSSSLSGRSRTKSTDMKPEEIELKDCQKSDPEKN